MKRCHRMNRSQEFARLRNEGRSRAGRYLVVATLQDGGEGYRVGFITSKKVGGAVVRNRVRRRLRALADASALRFVPGVMVVIIARYCAAEASFQALARDWERIALKLGILTQEMA